MEIIKLP